MTASDVVMQGKTIIEFATIKPLRTLPDGTMRKVLDVSRLNKQHWQTSTSLSAGIADTYKAYRSAL